MPRALATFVSDHAINEVVGFIMMFAISSIVLIIATHSFSDSKDSSDSVLRAVELKDVADRVATRIVQAGFLAQDYPNSTLDLAVRMPSEIDGGSYYVLATNSAVFANATDGSVRTNATTLRLDAIKAISVSGTVQSSSSEQVIVSYALVNGKQTITIHRS